jgi:hypothetical protein
MIITMETNNHINDNAVLEKYKNAIDYYWGASRNNKKSFKISRYLIIILGALVTLMSSISSAGFIEGIKVLKISFAILTPLLAAILTITGGFAQNFHWGAAWRDMVLNAMKLEKARDLFLARNPEQRDLTHELDNMHNLVIKETQEFFQRVLDGEIKPKDNEDSNKNSVGKS